MGSVRTLSLRGSLILVRSHLSFTLRCLKNNPLTVSLAPRFEALLADWADHFQSELDLQDQADNAQIAVLAVDGKLNRLARRASKAILTLTGDDRSHVLYVHHFGNKTLYVFERPILSEQLEAMRQWITSFQASEHASLKALGAELIPLITEADAAARAKANADQALANFRDVGERKAYIDQVNIARKETYGVLATLPHKHTGLQPNFADGFFRRAKIKAGAPEEPTITSVEAEIKALQEALAAKQVELEALKEQAKEAKTKEEERAAAQAKLEALEAEVAAKQKEAEALRAALEAAS